MPKIKYADNYKAKHALKTRNNAKARGLCVTCHKPESETGSRNGRAKCPQCQYEYRGYSAERSKSLLAAGLCKQCGKTPHVSGKKKCQACLDKHQNRSRDARKNNQCIVCLGPLDVISQIRCSKCRAIGNAQFRLRMQKKRAIVFEAYGGPTCVCCGETIEAFLTIDHIDESGSEHRRTDKSAREIYSWCIKNNFPPGFQVMCLQCNWARSAKSAGICPHKLQPVEYQQPFLFLRS